MKKNGFTLLELLAVIVILAVVALITVPLIMDIITDAKDKAFEESVRGAVMSVGIDAARKKFSIETYEVKDGHVYGDELIEMKGSIPGTGTISVSKEKGVKVVIQNGTICAYKDWDTKEIDYTKRNCPN